MNVISQCKHVNKINQDFLVINIVNLLSWINTSIECLRIRTDGNKVSSSQWLLWPPDTPLTFGAQAAINLDLLFVEHNLLLWCSLHLSKGRDQCFAYIWVAGQCRFPPHLQTNEEGFAVHAVTPYCNRHCPHCLPFPSPHCKQFKQFLMSLALWVKPKITQMH